MEMKQLSHRESEIVELAVQGFTNKSIASQLGLSVGTVNTYWLRVRMKVGGLARTDTVAKIIKDRADRMLHDLDEDRESLAHLIEDEEHSLLDLRNSLALLQLAFDQIESAMWVTDKNLNLTVIACGESPVTHCDVAWNTAKTVYEIFESTDPNNPAIAAHLCALKGKGAALKLKGKCSDMTLKTLPLQDDSHEIVGSIGILHYVGNSRDRGMAQLRPDFHLPSNTETQPLRVLEAWGGSKNAMDSRENKVAAHS